MPNKCRAYACKVTIATQYLMCRRHWAMVPLDMRREIFATVPSIGELPSADYATAVRAAINAVKNIEYPHTFVVEDAPAEEGSNNA